MRFVFFFVMCAVAAACYKPPISTASGRQEHSASSPNSAPSNRLGTTTTPIHYTLHLEIDPNQPTYSGHVNIDIRVTRATRTLWLHARELEINSAMLIQNGQTSPLTPFIEPGTSYLGLRGAHPVAVGSARIRIPFSGRFGAINGIFRQSQDNAWYAFSDFEPQDARKSFPCFDDPRFKATWDIALVVPTDHLAFANTDAVEERPLSQTQKLVRFAQTSPLPTYLVALAVGPFDVISGKASNTPLRIVAPKGLAERGRPILAVTDALLRWFESYLNMPVPYPKLDFVAIPRFGGGMENPGLITFSAGILLVGTDPQNPALRYAASVVAHELAHLWFGDLLTPKYWDDLWLSEGFATWLSDKALAAWQPERANEIVRITDKSTAYPIDHSSHPRLVRQTIRNQQDIDTAFNAITYRKGGAILGMLEAWLGEDRMKQKVQAYLRAHSNDNVGDSVDFSDLLTALADGAAPADNITDFMTTMTSLPGIALLNMELKCSVDSPPVLTISQSRYTPAAARNTDNAHWQLPVCVRYPDAAQQLVRHCVFLDKPTLEVPLKRRGCPKYWVANDGDSGYFHYQLSPKQFTLLNTVPGTPREHLGRLHSIVALVHSGAMTIEQALPPLDGLAALDQPELDAVLIRFLLDWERTTEGSEQSKQVGQRAKIWFHSRLHTLGILERPEDTEVQRQLRPMLLRLVAEVGGDRRWRDAVGEQVHIWLNNPVAMNWMLLDSWLQIAALENTVARQNMARNALHQIQGLQEFLVRQSLLNTKVTVATRITNWPQSPMMILRLAQDLRAAKGRVRIVHSLAQNRDKILGKNPTARQLKFDFMGTLFQELCDPHSAVAWKALAADEFSAARVETAIAHCLALKKGQHPISAS